jgi:uncharacterized membrane protein SirB2
MFDLPRLEMLLGWPQVLIATYLITSLAGVPLVVDSCVRSWQRSRNVSLSVLLWGVLGGGIGAMIYWMFRSMSQGGLGWGGVDLVRRFVIYLFFALAAAVIPFQLIRTGFGWVYKNRYNRNERWIRIFSLTAPLLLTMLGLLLLARCCPQASRLDWQSCLHDWLVTLGLLLVAYLPVGVLCLLENKQRAPLIIPFYSFFWHWKEDDTDWWWSFDDWGHLWNFGIFVFACLQVVGVYAFFSVLIRTAMLSGLVGTLLLLLTAGAAFLFAWLAGRLSIGVEKSINKSGGKIDRQDEWRRVGAHSGGWDATVADVYEHYHGRGSWRKSVRRQVWSLRIIGIAIAAGLPVLLSKNSLANPPEGRYFLFTGVLTTLCSIFGIVFAVRRRH